MSTRRFFLAVILGGIAVFLWGLISHEALPLYKNALVKFTDEQAVTQAIVANAPAPGVYFMPYVPQDADEMNADAFEASQEAAMQRIQDGPFMFASIRLGAMGSFPKYIGIQLATDMLTTLFLLLVVLRARDQSYMGRVLTCVLVALATFAVKSLPMWNWYEFSSAFTFAELVDIVGRMFCAGLVIAKLVPARRAVQG
jgi:hypothetical protein